MFYSKTPDGVTCDLCPHGCSFEKDERGICRTRVSRNGNLYTVAYNNPCAIHNDPVEKKPLAHFLPGSMAFSIAFAGCNLRCRGCQNWRISQFKPEDVDYSEFTPEDIVDMAEKEVSASIAYTYTEPSVFYEYMLDTGKLAREKGIKNIWVTAGFINEKPLRKLCKYIDAANIDLKGFTDEFYRTFSRGKLDPILRSIKILHEEGIWFEVTNLIVSTLNDDPKTYREMVRWLYKNIGPDHPVHISRSYPAYRLTHIPPTPIKLLHNLREIAMDEGLNFVYIGNVPDHLNRGKDTFCPDDGSLLIERHGYTTKFVNMSSGGVCKTCGRKIPGVWKL